MDRKLQLLKTFSQLFLAKKEGRSANMFRWLALAAIVAVCASEPEVVAKEAASPIRVVGYDIDRLDRQHEHGRIDRDREIGHRHHERENGREDNDREGHGDGPDVGLLVDPTKLLRSHGHEHESRKEKIIKNVYSPDFYQPTWILDYRYLKTGGREYTRSDGGQILILPKHVQSDEHTEFKNYDELLEFLRLKQLAESQAHLLHPEEGRKGSHGHHGYRQREDPREVPLQWQKAWV